MKPNAIFLAAALSLASASALAAGPLDLSSGSVSFGGSPAAGGFIENFTFTLDTPGILSGSITTVLNGLQDIDFSFIGLIGPEAVYAFTQLLADPFETWGLSATTVAAGDYTLTLIGSNTPALASFAGNLAVTPVPEPQTYALLLAGLLAGGFLLRRRSD